MPLVTSIFNSTMKSMGQEVKNHICPHFNYSRADLYNIISVKKLKTLADVMKEAGNDPESQGKLNLIGPNFIQRRVNILSS